MMLGPVRVMGAGVVVMMCAEEVKKGIIYYSNIVKYKILSIKTSFNPMLQDTEDSVVHFK